MTSPDHSVQQAEGNGPGQEPTPGLLPWSWGGGANTQHVFSSLTLHPVIGANEYLNYIIYVIIIVIFTILYCCIIICVQCLFLYLVLLIIKA